MSDLLIKGMDMPYDCGECRFFELYLDSDTRKIMGGIGECHAGQFVQTDYKRDEDCPLVEVKPHGRLVDGDKLLADHNPNENWDYMVLECIIRNAPTILEASE